MAECGFAGLVAYILSQIYLGASFYDKRKLRHGTQRVAVVFWYIFFGYTLCGTGVGLLYDPVSNLWLMFTFACLYKYAVTEPTPNAAFLLTLQEAQVA